MKNKLSEVEKKVLIRVMEELSIKEPCSFSEFPSLKRKEILKAINKLEKLGLIVFNNEINYWETTKEGDNFIQHNLNEFKFIYNEFYKNDANN